MSTEQDGISGNIGMQVLLARNAQLYRENQRLREQLMWANQQAAIVNDELQRVLETITEENDRREQGQQ